MWSSIVYSEALKPDLESFINFYRFGIFYQFLKLDDK
jgi:hypothetical protein